MKNRKRYLRYRARLRRIGMYGSFFDAQCPKCGNDGLFFYDKYDAECCLSCDSWLVNACTDENCPFCANRPPTPWSAFFSEDKINRDRKKFFTANFARKYGGELRHRIRREKREPYLKKNF